MSFPPVLARNDVNLNSRLKDIYVSEIVPLICAQGDDGNYGSAATRDIEALQLISRRIHFGKFVAEAKFMDPKEHDLYVELIRKRDKEGIWDLLTFKAVEERLLERVKRKAAIYGQDLMAAEAAASTSPTTKNAVLENLKIPLQVVSDIYEKIIIPLTKDVEVDYLLQRLESGEGHI